MFRTFILSMIAATFLFTTSVAEAVILDFEDLPDLTSVGEAYTSYGLHFQNAISLTAGFSLNEFDYPPSSGLIAIGDNNSPITIAFDIPVTNLFANFTYGSQLTFSAFNESDLLIGTYVHPSNSNLGTTELISLNFSGVSSLIIAGEWDNSYIMDDLNFDPIARPVPEPATIILLGGGILGLLKFRRISR